ncbi:MAG TPA: mechanosensitive ion channel, partial [Phycisphaerales bacterium]|nr:mechanosensitive ion channel [Phycisphaerales bacterium]
ALRCFDFTGVKQKTFQIEFAIRMLMVLDRIKEVEHSDFISFLYQRQDEGRYVYFPQERIAAHRKVRRLTKGRIVFERSDAGEWRFSKETVDGLNALERDLEILPSAFGEGDIPLTLSMLIRSRMPEALRRGSVFDVELWQWLGLLVVIFAGVVLDFIVRLLLRLVWGRIDHKRGVDRDRSLIKSAVRPFGLLAAGLLWYVSLRLLGLPATALLVLQIAVHVILILSGMMAAFRVVDLLSAMMIERAVHTETKIDDLLIPLVRKTLKTFIGAFGLIYIAESFDIQIIPLLTGLGIGGLAFAFAAKDTIENFFGSVAVILDKPFDIGDWVVIGDIEGTVEVMGLRSTRVRTFYNSLVTLPNASLVRATVDNYGRRRYRRYKTALSLTYDTPPEKVEAFCEGIREIIRLHPYTRKDYFHVWLNNFGAHSLDVLVYMFFDCPDWGTELRERHRLMLDIVRLASRIGVHFAFPTQTIELKRVGDAHPLDTPSRDTEARARRAGRQTAHEITEQQPWREYKPGPVLFGGGSDEHGTEGEGGE